MVIMFFLIELIVFQTKLILIIINFFVNIT